MLLKIDDLKESNAFLNDLYSNVTTAIFLADNDARLVSFNDSFKALFQKPEDRLIGELCGNAIGCIFQQEESVDCGATTHCADCDLRNSIIRSFTEKVPVFKHLLVREFNICGRVLRKHFVFTTKYAGYRGQEYVLVLVDDVTQLEEQREQLEAHNRALQQQLRVMAESLLASALELDLQKTTQMELERELRHRIGNTLQLIVSLLKLHEDGGFGLDDATAADGNPMADFADASQASIYAGINLYISALVTVYHHVQYEQGAASVSTAELIPSLCALASADQVGFVVHHDISACMISMDMAVPFSLAFVDLVSRVLDAQALRLEIEFSIDNNYFVTTMRSVDRSGSPVFGGRNSPAMAELMLGQLAGEIKQSADSSLRLYIQRPQH
ncbi:MAG: hypothetical protein KKI09_13970 [Spirochaetes bacterium]|nr:hypothetical protein [Spirochaetota bacterium]